MDLRFVSLNQCIEDVEKPIEVVETIPNFQNLQSYCKAHRIVEIIWKKCMRTLAITKLCRPRRDPVNCSFSDNI